MTSWRRGQAYAQHLRERVLAASGTLGEVVERLAVSKACVSRVRSRQERLGQSSAGAQRNHVPSALASSARAAAGASGLGARADAGPVVPVGAGRARQPDDGSRSRSRHLDALAFSAPRMWGSRHSKPCHERLQQDPGGAQDWSLGRRGFVAPEIEIASSVSGKGGRNQRLPAPLRMAASTLHGPGPAAARYKKTKQNSTAASPPLSRGKRALPWLAWPTK